MLIFSMVLTHITFIFIIEIPEVLIIRFYFVYSPFIYVDTNNWGLKVLGPYESEFFGQISLPQSPRQETFWASAGFESIVELLTLSDAPRRLALLEKYNLEGFLLYIKN